MLVIYFCCYFLFDYYFRLLYLFGSPFETPRFQYEIYDPALLFIILFFNYVLCIVLAVGLRTVLIMNIQYSHKLRVQNRQFQIP